MNKKLSLALVLPSLMFLTNCQTEKKESTGTTETHQGKAPAKESAKKDTPAADTKETVLLTIKDKPAITVGQFDTYVEEVSKAQPQLKQIMEFMPDAEQELFKSMESEVVLKNWIDEQGISKRADYQRDLELGKEFLERQLAIKYFQEEYPKTHKIEVTETEARKVYEERKDQTPELIVSRGGVTAMGVQFDDEKKATAFLDKIKASGADFEKIAKEDNLKVQHFKNINEQSVDVDDAVREKLLAITKFPSSDKVSSNGKFWVVKATAKEETQYVPFDQVKDQIMQQLKMQKLFTDELEKLKKQMDVVEHLQYFEKKKQARQEQMQKMQEQAEKSQKETKQKNDAGKKSGSQEKTPAPKPKNPVQGA